MRLLWRLIRTELKQHAGALFIRFLVAACVAAAPYGLSMLGRWLVNEVLQVSGPPKQAVAEVKDSDEVKDSGEVRDSGEVADPGGDSGEAGGADEIAESGEGAGVAEDPEGVEVAGVTVQWREKSPEEKLRLLGVFFGVSIGVHVLLTALSGGSEILNSRMVHQMTFRLRRRLYRKLQSMDMAVFSREQVGQLMTRVMDDAAGIPANLTNLVINFFTQIAMLVLGLVLLMKLNPTTSLIALAALPLYAVACLIFLPRIKQNTEELRDRVAEMNGHLVERLSNVATIKNYAQEARETDAFERRLDRNLGLSRRQQRLNLFFNTLTTLITGGGTLAVLAFGFVSIRAQRMELGDVLAAYQVTAQLFVPISALVGLTTVAQTLQVLGGRIYSVLDAPSAISEPAPSELPVRFRGEIEFANVSLRYQEGGPFALTDVSLHIPAGATACLVGPTGCGKSTLIALLTRLYDPGEGAVKLDGIDIRRIPTRLLRRSIGNVLHDCTVFAGTLAENIAYGLPDAPMEEIERVAATVGLDEFARRQPDGYETQLGTGGAALDAEQLARLGLARALITDPAVLTVDDTYATIPEQVERPLRRAVRAALADRTILIATSRLSICEDADIVVVMRKGRIEQTGTHAELIAQPGLYSSMYTRQMGLEPPEGITNAES
jgi:ABC-type multidrug transport system fused ATPase/permease subunit